MPTLRCDCGTEVQVPDDEAQELTWCPRCHKTLIQPRGYQLPARDYRSGQAAAPRGPAGNGIGAAGRVIGILAMAVIFGLGRASCHSSRYDPPNITVPRFDPQPAPRFDPKIVWPPPKEWPGAGPQDPAGPNPGGNWRNDLERILEGQNHPRNPLPPPADRP